MENWHLNIMVSNKGKRKVQGVPLSQPEIFPDTI